MRRFFYAPTMTDSQSSQSALNSLAKGDEIELTASIFHHWAKVLRANVGDEGILFDGFGGETRVKLCQIDKKTAKASVLDHLAVDRDSSLTTMIGLVMSRGDRMDYAIQKATELGVSAIWLLTSQHGEVTLKADQVAKKLAHWQQVAIAACEQSGLNRVPLIIAPRAIGDWLRLPFGEGLAILPDQLTPIVAGLSLEAYYRPLQEAPAIKLVLSVPKEDQPLMPALLLSHLHQPRPYVQLLIGAEGGLSDEEMTLAQDSGFLPWQIGDRVLRTETAPVVALATLQALKSTIKS